MPINIAIDGPAGAGKSTVARTAAERLGFIYVDTGALYRTVGLYSIRKGLDTQNAESVESTLSDINIKLAFEDGEQKVYLNGEDVSSDIRTPEASMGASNVSSIPSVRAFLFDLQKNIAKENDCLMDGRDIGTVVLPNADVKIFLTASPEVRAKRRYDELIKKGADVKFDDVLEDLQKRDYQDSHRDIAPLKVADDAQVIDTGSFDFEQSVAAVLNAVNNKLKR